MSDDPDPKVQLALRRLAAEKNTVNESIALGGRATMAPRRGIPASGQGAVELTKLQALLRTGRRFLPLR